MKKAITPKDAIKESNKDKKWLKTIKVKKVSKKKASKKPNKWFAKKSTWTQFWDMHSGGPLKEKWHFIYIEAPIEEAKIIFYNRFGHNPDRVTCTCCGEDYSISESKWFTQISGFHRGCKNIQTPRDEKGLYVKVDNDEFNKHYYLEEGEGPPKGYEIEKNSYGSTLKKYITCDDYIKQEDVLVIFKKDIKDSDRLGSVPEQGYVWVD
jgi:hypothetical protein